MNHDRERAQGNDPGHEPLSISIKAVAVAAVSLVALIAAAIIGMGLLSRLLSPRDAAEDVESSLRAPAEAPQRTVGLHPNQAEDRLALEESQRKWLDEYSWLDEQEQVARIPIERAMQIFRDQGFQVEAPSEEPPSAAPGKQAAPGDQAGTEEGS